MRHRYLIPSGSWIFPLVMLFCLIFDEPYAHGQQAVPVISVTVNKTLVFRLAEKAKRLSITQPEVADVLVVAPNQILINGKSVGTTSLVVFDEGGNVTNYDLVVIPDIAALRMQLRALFPDEQVEISTSGPSIVLKGEVSNEVVYDKVIEVTLAHLPPRPSAEVGPPAAAQSVSIQTTKTTVPTSGTGFAGGGQLAFDDEGKLTDVDRFGDKRAITGIIDLLKIKEVRQVELAVVVAEVSTGKLREAGLEFLISDVTSSRTLNLENLLAGQSGIGGPNLALSIIKPDFSFDSLIRLLQNKNVSNILAQPKLVMKNGRSGGFLAGGEFPIPAIGGDTASVEFKPFGVRLDFVPTITWSDTIDLRVFEEVSEIDQSVSVNGIPGLSVRRTVNRVEMAEGESLVIAGLLDRRVLKDLTKVPILGDIPILGALFRSTRFTNNESELVFVITPRVVRPFKVGERVKLPALEKYDDPDIRQVPLPESQGGMSRSKKPAAQGATIP
jgi:pilus assembly protein CpaC